MSASPHNPEDSASEPLPNDAATQAAAQAAAALSQLAAALSAAKLPFDNLHSSRHVFHFATLSLWHYAAMCASTSTCVCSILLSGAIAALHF